MGRGTAWQLCLIATIGAGCDAVWGLERPDALHDSDPNRVCDHGGTFPTGHAVPIAGSYSVEGARFTPTESIAYLSLCSNGKPSCDLFTGMFSADGTLGGFNMLGSPSTANVYDSYPTVSSDLQYLLFGSGRSGGVHVFVGAAVNGNLGLAIPKQPSVTQGIADTNEPFLIGTRILYFAGTASESPMDWNIYRAEADPPDFGTTPALVTSANSNAQEFAPVLTDDELEIFFSSNRRTPADEYALDIFTATRSNKTGAFTTPTYAGNLSTPGIDWPLWISVNGCRLYYINKPNDMGIGKLFVTER
jgi:hypothetical protein